MDILSSNATGQSGRRGDELCSDKLVANGISRRRVDQPDDGSHATAEHVFNARAATDRPTAISDIRFVFGRGSAEFGGLAFNADDIPAFEALDEYGCLELQRSQLYGHFPERYDGQIAEIRRALRAWMMPRSLLEIWVDGCERLRLMVDFSACEQEILEAVFSIHDDLDLRDLAGLGSTVAIYACGAEPPTLRSVIARMNNEIPIANEEYPWPAGLPRS